MSSQDYQNQKSEIFFTSLKNRDGAKKKKKSTDIFFLGIREQSSDRSTTN